MNENKSGMMKDFQRTGARISTLFACCVWGDMSVAEPRKALTSVSSSKRKFWTRPKAMAVVIHWTIAKGKKAKGNRKMLNKVMTVNAFEAVMVTPVNVALCDETRKTGNVCQSIQSETKILKMWRRRIRTGLVSTQDDFIFQINCFPFMEWRIATRVL